MKKEMDLTFTGDNKEDAFKALKSIKKFVAKKPEKDFYRHIYVNVENNEGVEYIKSDGGYLSKDLKIDEICDEAETIINEVVDFKRFDIMATIRTPLFKS